MAKVTTVPLTSLTSNEASAVSTINANFAAIAAAMDNTFSRDGTTPNSLSADLDANSKNIANVGSINATSYLSGGTPFVGLRGPTGPTGPTGPMSPTVSSNLTVGYTANGYSAGTKSSGTFTPDPTLGGLQYVTNGGAHTLAVPSLGTGTAVSLVIHYTNNATAGAVTTSGYTKVSGAFTTTNNDKFMCFITVVNGSSLLSITALQ